MYIYFLHKLALLLKPPINNAFFVDVRYYRTRRISRRHGRLAIEWLVN